MLIGVLRDVRKKAERLTQSVGFRFACVLQEEFEREQQLDLA